MEQKVRKTGASDTPLTHRPLNNPAHLNWASSDMLLAHPVAFP